ncbi:MAG TPA: SRPBCC family protein [Gaiellales bacterium]|nr:SRPBCC family protein [Gaiellales bacterium]
MAVNTIVIEAPPDAVFDVLSDGRLYAEWVVGAHHSVPVDPRWPEPGATLVHRSGIPPVTLQDTTSVISSNRPGRMRLEARVRPLVIATVDLTIQPHADGSIVSMEERVVGGVARYAPRWLNHAAFRRRNMASLARLRAIVLGRTSSPSPAAGRP